MILDAHTHAFPPAFVERRAELLRRDPTFAELYANPKAKLATADEILACQTRAGVDASVIAGFAWRDTELCREQNEYLLHAAASSAGRLLPFCTLPLGEPEAARYEVIRCIDDGACGFGELRPESQVTSLVDGAVAELLSWVAETYDVPLLVHASEPVGHAYPGKAGQSIDALYGFINQHPEVRLIAAHWGGGLPFYALMPEVKVALRNVWVDTAATSLLYDGRIFRTVCDLLDPEHVLFGSDYPLLAPERQIARIRAASLTGQEEVMLLGENAARLLRLVD